MISRVAFSSSFVRSRLISARFECERVVANLMTFVVDLFDQLHVVFRVQSDQEKSGRNMFFFQHLQNLRSIFRVGSVIKCKHDLLFGLAESSYDVRRWIAEIRSR